MKIQITESDFKSLHSITAPNGEKLYLYGVEAAEAYTNGNYIRNFFRKSDFDIILEAQS